MRRPPVRATSELPDLFNVVIMKVVSIIPHWTNNIPVSFAMANLARVLNQQT